MFVYSNLFALFATFDDVRSVLDYNVEKKRKIGKLTIFREKTSRTTRARFPSSFNKNRLSKSLNSKRFPTKLFDKIPL